MQKQNDYFRAQEEDRSIRRIIGSQIEETLDWAVVEATKSKGDIRADYLAQIQTLIDSADRMGHDLPEHKKLYAELRKDTDKTLYSASTF